MAASAQRPFDMGDNKESSLSRRALLKAGGWLTGVRALLGAGALSAKPASASMQGEPLIGSWLTQVQREGEPPAINMLTFGGGVLVITGNDPSLAPGHGAWVRTGEREYDVTFRRLRYGPDGTFVGFRVVRNHTLVDPTLDAWTNTGIREDFDFDGNSVGSGPVSGQATRIKVEPVA